MLSVFICEDDLRYQEVLYKWIQNYIDDEHLDIEILLRTSDPLKIINTIKTEKVNGLYFLDVELKGGHNGVAIAKDIRQYDPRGFIVFITAHPDYMSLTFEYNVEALAYIQKTDSSAVRKKIYDCINDAYNKHVSRSDDARYIFKTQSGRRISCALEDILFFQTDSRGSKRIVLHTQKRPYIFYGSLDEVMKMLPVGQFYKCHKSCVVNVKYITDVCIQDLNKGKSVIIMPNGSECQVSSRKKSGLRKMAESTK